MEGKKENTEILLQQLITLKEQAITAESFRKKLSASVNDLINDDFEKLVQLLYRLDIDEYKLKKTLQEHADRDAGGMIADLIIERQMQKIKSRKEFNKRGDNGSNNDTDEEEKW